MKNLANSEIENTGFIPCESDYEIHKNSILFFNLATGIVILVANKYSEKYHLWGWSNQKLEEKSDKDYSDNFVEKIQDDCIVVELFGLKLVYLAKS